MLRFGLLLLIVLFIYCNPDKKSPGSGTITIFQAGSLSYPFREVIHAFNKEYPDIRVLTESSGSVAAARKITDLNRICDIYATADYKVIEELLFPGHAEWYVAFARNELALVFTDKSLYADEIMSKNWTEIVLRRDVRFGRSDPNSDPCGYRTLLMWQLASGYYEMPGLYNKLLIKDTRFIRPKEVDLLALLETNTVDYTFLYRSIARQHGLQYLILPDSINLGNPDLEEYYRNAMVEVKGAAPDKKIIFYGEPMVYAVTIPIKANNPQAAAVFLNFLLDRQKGLKIMEMNGQTPIFPLVTKNMHLIPESLSISE